MSEWPETELIERAIETAGAAWSEAHRGLASNPMTRTAAIPAIGVVAASILTRLRDGDEQATAAAVEAISTARRAWERCNLEVPANPMAKTAEKAAIGILAAGILNAAVSPLGVGSVEAASAERDEVADLPGSVAGHHGDGQ